MPGLLTALRRWTSAPQSRTNYNSVEHNDSFSPDPKHVGELAVRPVDQHPVFATRMLQPPPARGAEEVQRWLAAGSPTDHLPELTRARDEAAESVQRRTLLGKPRKDPAYALRPVEKLYLGHHVPKSIAMYSEIWIKQTMFDLYHPLGDRESYFVWFSGVKSPYPSRVGHTDGQQRIPDDPHAADFVSTHMWDRFDQTWGFDGKVGPLAGLVLHTVARERHWARRARLRLPPWPTPLSKQNQDDEVTPRFWMVDLALYERGFQDVDAAVDAYLMRRQQQGLPDDAFGLLHSGRFNGFFSVQGSHPVWWAYSPDDEFDGIDDREWEARFFSSSESAEATAAIAGEAGPSANDDDAWDPEAPDHISLDDGASFAGDDDSDQDDFPTHLGDGSSVYGYYEHDGDSSDDEEPAVAGPSNQSLPVFSQGLATASHLLGAGQPVPYTDDFSENDADEPAAPSPVAPHYDLENFGPASMISPAPEGGEDYAASGNVYGPLRLSELAIFQQEYTDATQTQSEDSSSEYSSRDGRDVPVKPDTEQGAELLELIRRGLSLPSGTPYLEIQDILIKTGLFRPIVHGKVPGSQIHEPGPQYIYERNIDNREQALALKIVICAVVWADTQFSILVNSVRLGYDGFGGENRQLLDAFRHFPTPNQFLRGIPEDSSNEQIQEIMQRRDFLRGETRESERGILVAIRSNPDHTPLLRSPLRESFSAQELS
ncbi:hypothetical protein CC79DRAFT_1364624 [Sarocladium strictum]